MTGGAGYIGSFVTRELVKHSETYSVPSVVVLDRVLPVPHMGREGSVKYVTGDCRDSKVLDAIFAQYGRFSAVVHLAADCVVPASLEYPLRYYDNNVCSLIQVLSAMQRHQCSRMVFASSSTVEPVQDGRCVASVEDHGSVLHPYLESKLWGERILQQSCYSHGMIGLSLRFFNACGAAADGSVGECHDPETHLIPRVLQIPLDDRMKRWSTQSFKIFGSDYKTKDGTCVRDYVHVEDIARAVRLALYVDPAMMKRSNERHSCAGRFEAISLGTGVGTSVLEVVSSCRKVTQHAIPITLSPRRAGDAAEAVANPDRARELLSWTSELSVDQAVASAWRYCLRSHNME